mgnify:CR=1 FL=1
MQRRSVFTGLVLAVLVGVFFYLRVEQRTQIDFEQVEPIPGYKMEMREVFGALIRGYTITEIAERLHLSVKTVDTHKSHIYAKLNCRRRSELVSLALQHGLLQ